MIKLLRHCSAVAAVTAFSTLALAAAVGAAPAQGRSHHERVPGASAYRGYYDYVPGPAAGSDYQSENGTPIGPPDPASCGGFAC